MELYEHRKTIVASGRFKDYRRLILEDVWGRLDGAGLRPLCFLNVLIGGVPEETHTFIGYPSWDDWQRGQEIMTGVGDDAGAARRNVRREIVLDEEVRPMIAFSGRPLPETPLEDRRPLYGLRRWMIDPAQWEHFTDLSANGIWPAQDAMGHRVLGQFRTAALTDPLEVLNLPGYHSVGHWHETKSTLDPASGVSEELRQRLAAAGDERSGLIRRSWIQLANAHWPGQPFMEIRDGIPVGDHPAHDPDDSDPGG